METIAKQVGQARRRLLCIQFFRTLCGAWFAAFVVAAVAIGAGKFWPPAVSQTAWVAGWLIATALVGLAAAAIRTWLRACSPLDAALEIDRRFGLQERVATAMGLGPVEIELPMGQAVLRDASQRLALAPIADRFPVRMGRAAWLPLAAALLAVTLAWLAPVRTNPQAAAAASNAAHVQSTAKSLEKKLAEKRAEARAEGLAEADDLLKKLEEGTRHLADKQAGEKQALMGLNDLAKELQARREKLMGDNAIKQRLGELNDLDHGPGEKLAQAMKNGDFNAGRQELEKLEKRLGAGDLKPEEQQQLGEQLAAMQKKLDAAVAAHNQAQRELERQVAEQQAAGNSQAAERLERQLDELKKQAPAMKQLGRMSQKLGQAGQCMKQGQCDGAKGALAELNDDLKSLQKADDELTMLDEAMQQIGEAKAGMACKECDGEGCKACRGGKADPHDKAAAGGGKVARQGNRPGSGIGHGTAQHNGPEDTTKKNFYDTRVSQNVGKGAATVEGHVAGPNRRGEVQEEIKDRFESAERDAADPLTNQRLPRDYREHAKKYFDSLRGASD